MTLFALPHTGLDRATLLEIVADLAAPIDPMVFAGLARLCRDSSSRGPLAMATSRCTGPALFRTLIDPLLTSAETREIAAEAIEYVEDDDPA